MDRFVNDQDLERLGNLRTCLLLRLSEKYCSVCWPRKKPSSLSYRRPESPSLIYGRAHSSCGLPPWVFDGELAVRDPAPGSRVSGSASGACFAGPRFPRPRPSLHRLRDWLPRPREGDVHIAFNCESAGDTSGRSPRLKPARFRALQAFDLPLGSGRDDIVALEQLDLARRKRRCGQKLEDGCL